MGLQLLKQELLEEDLEEEEDANDHHKINQYYLTYVQKSYKYLLFKTVNYNLNIKFM
jgi:hypothetical protein